MQRVYENELAIAVPGLLHGCGNAKIDKFANTGGLVHDTWEIAIPATPDPDTTYSITADGATATYKTGASPTQSELESGLFMAMRTSPSFTTKAESVIDSTTHKISVSARLVNVAIAVTATPGSLTTTRQTTNLKELSVIPFGRVVGRKPDYLYNQAGLITAATDQIVGVTISTHAVEQIEQVSPSTSIYGVTSSTGYKPLDVMNVIARTNDLTGVYVECMEDIKLTDSPYVSYAQGSEGKLTKNSTSSIAIADIAKFERPSSVERGINLVLLSFNQK